MDGVTTVTDRGVPPAAEELHMFLGEPIEPHGVDGVEANRYYCSRCGHEVDNDAGDWFHVDPRYGSQEPDLTESELRLLDGNR